MTTVAQMRNGTRYYGCWAGDPEGRPEDPACCIEGVWPNERGASEHQCTRRRGFGPDGLYCRQHDPGRRAQRRAEMGRAAEQKRAGEEAIRAEAETLATRLGIEADVDYSTVGPPSRWGYRDRMVVSFAALRQLADRLQAPCPNCGCSTAGQAAIRRQRAGAGR